MGYHTEFTGSVAVEPPLNAAEVSFLRDFSEERHDGNNEVGPSGSVWCDWIATDDGTAITWNQTEKFYDSAAWMQFLIDTYLRPGASAAWGGDPRFARFTFDHIVNGQIEAVGEDRDDVWMLAVTDNQVSKVEAPTAVELAEANPDLAAAVATMRQLGITVGQFADLTGQEV